MWSPTDVAFVVGTYVEDVHYCRPLLASIRHHCPDHEIIVIVDGDLRGDELPDWPGVRIVRSADLAAEAGLPLTGYLAKLNLFRWDEFEYYAYFDADSVLTTRLFDRPLFTDPADFYALGGGWVDVTDPEARAGFNRSSLNIDRVRAEIDPDFGADRLFSAICGHFVVRPHPELLELIVANLDHTSRRWETGPVFHVNEQSLLIYALNRLASDGVLTVRGGDHMVIPRGDSRHRRADLTVGAVTDGTLADPYVLHWTRPCRTGEFADHELGDILEHFEAMYYEATPGQSAPRHRRRRRRRDLSRRVRKGIRARIEKVVDR